MESSVETVDMNLITGDVESEREGIGLWIGESVIFYDFVFVWELL